jgi:hypothetical protein
MLRVPDWSGFQHYKDRTPPWLKLPRRLIDDVNYHGLSAEAAKCLMLIWIVASDTRSDDGRLPDSKALAFRLRVSQRDLELIVGELIIAGFLELVDNEQNQTHSTAPASAEQPASGALARPEQVARSEESREEGEREGEAERETDLPLAEARSSAGADLFGAPPPAATKPARKVDRSSDIDAVNQHYVTHHPRAAKHLASTTDEYKKIRARLEQDGFTVDDLKHAIDGCHKSPYHCGENAGGTKYQSLELIVRDRTHVQKFMEIADEHSRGAVPVLSERERRGHRATDAFLALTDPNRKRGEPISAEVIS